MGSFNGYILLHRSIYEHWTWEDKPFSKGQAWIDILMFVNHKEATIPFNGDVLKLDRGEALTSIEKLSTRWGWSRKKTANFINMLKRDDMLHTKRTGKGTVLTVVNYDNFQDRGTEKEQVRDSKRNGWGTGKEHKQRTTNNNKEKKEINKKEILSKEEQRRRLIERQRAEEEERVHKIIYGD